MLTLADPFDYTTFDWRWSEIVRLNQIKTTNHNKFAKLLEEISELGTIIVNDQCAHIESLIEESFDVILMTLSIVEETIRQARPDRFEEFWDMFINELHDYDPELILYYDSCDDYTALFSQTVMSLGNMSREALHAVGSSATKYRMYDKHDEDFAIRSCIRHAAAGMYACCCIIEMESSVSQTMKQAMYDSKIHKWEAVSTFNP